MGGHKETVEQRKELYSAGVIAESSNPSNMGRMLEPDAYGIVHGSCGDTVEIYLRLDGNRIETVTFTTDGRESVIACGSILTKMVRGLSLEEAGNITPEGLIAALGGLPKIKAHCANLMLSALWDAIANWGEGKKG